MSTIYTNIIHESFDNNTLFCEKIRKNFESTSQTALYNGGYEEYEDEADYIRIKAVLTR